MQHDLETLDNEAEQIVKKMGIPPCPAILTKLMREMRNDEPDFPKIGQFISQDVGLAAAMLKTVNSSFYGLQTKATSVSKALALLGLRNVAQLVTGLLLRQAFPVGHSKAMEEFWESSSSIALITSHLVGGRVKGAHREDAYTFALFRDCGVPAMMNAFPGYLPPHGSAAGGLYESMTDLENDQYKMNHASTGHVLAKSWMLPDGTCDAVLHHHEYAEISNGSIDISAASIKLVMLALTAECLYSLHSTGVQCPEWSEHAEFALEQLGITETEFDATAKDMRSVLTAR